MASLNPAVWHGLDDIGAIAPGYQADLLVLPDLESFVPELVLKRGKPVERDPAAGGARVGQAHRPHPRGRLQPLRHPLGRRRARA